MEHDFFLTFQSVGNVIIPTVTHSIIFQRGRSATNQITEDEDFSEMDFPWAAQLMFMPTAAKPYVRFATFLRIALCLGVGVGWGINVMCRVRGTRSCLTSPA